MNLELYVPESRADMALRQWESHKDGLQWGGRAKLAKWIDTLDGAQLGMFAVELALMANLCNGDITTSAGSMLKILGIDPAKEQKLLAEELAKKADEAKASGNGKKK